MIKYVRLEEKYLDSLCEADKVCFKVNWSRNLFEQEITNDKAYYILALNEENVVGYGGLNYVLDEGYITNIAVIPKFRNMGIASELLKYIEEYAKGIELEFITLEVRESNLSAINLYNKFGFERVGMRKNYYSDNRETAILMTKTLKRQAI